MPSQSSGFSVRRLQLPDSRGPSQSSICDEVDKGRVNTVVSLVDAFRVTVRIPVPHSDGECTRARLRMAS